MSAMKVIVPSAIVAGGFGLGLYRLITRRSGGVPASGGAKPVVATRDFNFTAVDSSAVLGKNASLFNKEELKVVQMLIASKQAHLFENWPAKGTDDGKKKNFIEQVMKLDESYPSGGIAGYISNARKLLADSKAGVNPFEGYDPTVPDGENLTYGDAAFKNFEKDGIAAARDAVFVLVAGGLGERLGYSGIKIALPSESATNKCFLQLYIESILALEAACAEGQPGGWMTRRKLPLVIMTSDDTHAKTLALLEANRYFGMSPKSVTLVKQEKVACLQDNNARLALDPKDPYSILMKPHGHGDVHSLLFSSGVIEKFKAEGAKWVCFFQDTNGLVFKAFPAALGVSVKKDMDVNSLCVCRKAGEAIGAITKLTHKDGRSMTINVEYNQLDPLLRATAAFAGGDTNDPSTGFSPFPGNINQLILKIDPYLAELRRTSGVISEFVNPKYKDSSKMEFKSPTRLECMMQDFPKTLPANANVGFTVINPTTAAYSPVKNSPADALAKAKAFSPSHSATSGELDMYEANVNMMILAGAQVGEATRVEYNGLALMMQPRVVLSPRFALTVDQLKKKINGFATVLSKDSVLVVDGRDVQIDSARVEGALVIKAVSGARVRVTGLNVKNRGWEYRALSEAEKATASEEELIRGFRVIKHETAEYVFDKPGDYILTD